MIKIISLLKLLKTRLGILILLTIATFTFVFLTKKPPIQPNPVESKELKTAQVYFSLPEKQKEQPVTTINRSTAAIKTTVAPQPKVLREIIVQCDNEIKSPKGANLTTIDKQIPIILDIYNKVMKAPPEEEIVNIKPIVEKDPRQPVPPEFAPFGRMIKCELVNTVDSGNIETPIIGLVMEPVYWNEDLIIPVGSEIHGIATTDKLRERIVSGNTWNIILPSDGDRPNGAALKITGVALDREDPSGEGKSYGITDGSFGLKGYRIKSNNLEEIKVFAATFLGSITSGLQNQVPSESPFGGTKPSNTFRDASLGGITAVMTRLAEKIEKEIEDNGFYTRVPAGKQFYLYVQQNINPDDWDMAGSLTGNEPSIENADVWMEKITLLKDKLTEIEK